MFFIGVFGMESNRKILREFRNIICPSCGKYSFCTLEYTYDYFHFFFIPIIRWNKRYFLRFSCCGAVYTCDKETAKAAAESGKYDINDFEKAGAGTQKGRACPNCGAQVAEEFAYCPFCGTRI